MVICKSIRLYDGVRESWSEPKKLDKELLGSLHYDLAPLAREEK